MKTPGQRAYEAWNNAHSVKLTPWGNLSKWSKSVWEAVAKAAREGI